MSANYEASRGEAVSVPSKDTTMRREIQPGLVQ